MFHSFVPSSSSGRALRLSKDERRFSAESYSRQFYGAELAQAHDVDELHWCGTTDTFGAAAECLEGSRLPYRCIAAQKCNSMTASVKSRAMSFSKDCRDCYVSRLPSLFAEIVYVRFQKKESRVLTLFGLYLLTKT